MIKKSNIRVLVIDRPLSPHGKDNPMSLFTEYRDKGYGVIIFPYISISPHRAWTEIVVVDTEIMEIDEWQNFLGVMIPQDYHDQGDIVYDFELQVAGQEFLNILEQKFSVSSEILTQLERNN